MNVINILYLLLGTIEEKIITNINRKWSKGEEMVQTGMSSLRKIHSGTGDNASIAYFQIGILITKLAPPGFHFHRLQRDTPCNKPRSNAVDGTIQDICLI